MKTGDRPRIVLDTNVIVSGILFKGHTVRDVLATAVDAWQLVFPDETWDELALVMQRPKFEKHMPIAARLAALAALARHIEIVTVVSVIDECRDAKDNKFLALAIDAGAALIVTGDDDLLVLNTFQGVEILNATSFHSRFCDALNER
jgi:uncharacterized protein